MFSSKTYKYRELSRQDVEQAWDSNERSETFHYRYLISLWILSILATIVLSRQYYISVLSMHISPVDHIAAINTYSPVYRDIDLHLVPTVPDLPFWDNESSIWRQEPSPEVDQAWHPLSHSNSILISKSDMIKLGKSLDVAVQWPDDPTGETYLAKMNVFHLLHCLNELRKAAHPDYYWPDGHHKKAGYWSHTRHCIDMLRQEIMCTASLDVHTFVWAEVQDSPMPDFEMNRRCRRWEDVVDWLHRHQLSDEGAKRVDRLTAPPGAQRSPVPKNGKELLYKIKNHINDAGEV